MHISCRPAFGQQWYHLGGVSGPGGRRSRRRLVHTRMEWQHAAAAGSGAADSWLGVDSAQASSSLSISTWIAASMGSSAASWRLLTPSATMTEMVRKHSLDAAFCFSAGKSDYKY